MKTIKKIKAGFKARKAADGKTVYDEDSGVTRNDNTPMKAKLPAATTTLAKSSAPTQTRGQAYAAARKAGKKVFSYNGKSYTTESAEEKADRLGEGKRWTDAAARIKEKAELIDMAPKTAPKTTKPSTTPSTPPPKTNVPEASVATNRYGKGTPVPTATVTAKRRLSADTTPSFTPPSKTTSASDRMNAVALKKGGKVTKKIAFKSGGKVAKKCMNCGGKVSSKKK